MKALIIATGGHFLLKTTTRGILLDFCKIEVKFGKKIKVFSKVRKLGSFKETVETTVGEKIILLTKINGPKDRYVFEDENKEIFTLERYEFIFATS